MAVSYRLFDVFHLVTISSALLFIVGIFIYTPSRTAKVPLLLTSVVRILAEGEATERKYTQEGAEVTDLLAQLTVSISGIKKVSAVPAAIKENKAEKAFRNSVPNAEKPYSIINTPLKRCIPSSIQTSLKEDTTVLEETLNSLTQTLKTYGYTI